MFEIAFALALTAAEPPRAATGSECDERICRGGGQRQLGSHIRTRRRCLTAEQWRQEDEARPARPRRSRSPKARMTAATTATPR